MALLLWNTFRKLLIMFCCVCVSDGFFRFNFCEVVRDKDGKSGLEVVINEILKGTKNKVETARLVTQSHLPSLYLNCEMNVLAFGAVTSDFKT